MKHLTLIALLTLTACSSRPKPYTERELGEVKPYTESLKCQLELMNRVDTNLSSISEFRVYRRPEVSKLVRAMRKELMDCTRVKSELELELERVAGNPSEELE